MKNLSSIIKTRKIIESFASKAMVPAQPLAEPLGAVPGVSNHYTPIQNIITNVRNLFAPYFGLVVEPGEDGVSIKIHNSGFISKKAVNDILYKKVDRFTSVADYICQQGLCAIKLVNVGKFYVVYFCPTDIRTAENPNVMSSDIPGNIDAPCQEQLYLNIEEAELSSINEESVSWDEEMEDKTKDQIIELLDNPDKIKAANEFAEMLSHAITLPEGVYVKAVKDSTGNESIAIRKKCTKRRPFGQSVEIVKSLINIYHKGNDGIWVDPFENKEALEDDVINLITSILTWIGAEETGDPCVWKLNIAGTEDNQENDEKESDIQQDGQLHESLNERQKYAYLVYDDADCIIGAFPDRKQAMKFADEFSSENNVDTRVKRIYRSEIETKD